MDQLAFEWLAFQQTLGSLSIINLGSSLGSKECHTIGSFEGEITLNAEWHLVHIPGSKNTSFCSY
jgi:hypothetical protein